MSDLDAYLSSRFGPVFDALNDAGGVPDELMECLKRGAVWQLAEGLAGSNDHSLTAVSLNWHNGTTNGPFAFLHGMKYGASRHSCEQEKGVTPETLFPHLSHLIESEALT